MDNPSNFRTGALVQQDIDPGVRRIIIALDTPQKVINSLQGITQFAFLNDNWYVCDPNETGRGIYLNNQRIPSKVPVAIRNRDSLQFGSHQYLLFDEGNGNEIIEFFRNGPPNEVVPNQVEPQAAALANEVLPNGIAVFLAQQSQALKCPTCFDYFHTPTTVSCGHTFCKRCLVKWSIAQMTTNEIIDKGICQTCRDPIEWATTNYLVANMVDNFLHLPDQENELREWKQNDEVLIEVYGREVISDLFTRYNLRELLFSRVTERPNARIGNAEVEINGGNPNERNVNNAQQRYNEELTALQESLRQMPFARALPRQNQAIPRRGRAPAQRRRGGSRRIDRPNNVQVVVQPNEVQGRVPRRRGRPPLNNRPRNNRVLEVVNPANEGPDNGRAPVQRRRGGSRRIDRPNNVQVVVQPNEVQGRVPRRRGRPPLNNRPRNNRVLEVVNPANEGPDNAQVEINGGNPNERNVNNAQQRYNDELVALDESLRQMSFARALPRQNQAIPRRGRAPAQRRRGGSRRIDRPNNVQVVVQPNEVQGRVPRRRGRPPMNNRPRNNRVLEVVNPANEGPDNGQVPALQRRERSPLSDHPNNDRVLEVVNPANEGPDNGQVPALQRRERSPLSDHPNNDRVLEVVNPANEGPDNGQVHALQRRERSPLSDHPNNDRGVERPSNGGRASNSAGNSRKRRRSSSSSSSSSAISIINISSDSDN